jgi:hypothetical protein
LYRGYKTAIPTIAVEFVHGIVARREVPCPHLGHAEHGKEERQESFLQEARGVELVEVRPAERSRLYCQLM